MSESTLISYGGKLTREQLALVPTPPGTATHRPIPHAEVIEALIETMGFRHIGVVKDEYAISKDGMKLFGVLDLDTGMHGCRFSIGIRNSHDKSMRLAMTVGYRMFVCENMAFHGDFQPVLAKHFSFDGRAVNRRGRDAVQLWRHAHAGRGLARVAALGCAGQADHLPGVHRIRPGSAQAPGEAGPRAVLQPAAPGISAPDDVEPVQRLHRRVQVKELEPIPQFRATAKLGGFLASQ